ncbi:hypothetical protein GCM10009753_08810 [Streptantibioticus ferralitis]
MVEVLVRVNGVKADDEGMAETPLVLGESDAQRGVRRQAAALGERERFLAGQRLGEIARGEVVRGLVRGGE